ncbi:MAG: polysulfide reductase NrfD [Alphaproteobacteria bacterium]|nr:polysulfide reductase NrfD [Alphaproteobacteria bacterium]
MAAGALAGLGVLAAWHMEESGHVITGMNNQIVWGMPHVFAIFLIVAASGVLNVASIGSVFGRAAYKPLARLSGLLAIALLIGGLAVLVLDLGRPERLIVAMTHFNFRSIFAWNIFLYTGFLAVVVIYLWTLMERRMNGWVPVAGMAAFLWRLGLTSGTGLIFGFLVAREAYDAAVMAPLFIAMSFAFGLAIFVLVLAMVEIGDDGAAEHALRCRLGRLLAVFVAITLYFATVQHLTNLYAAEHTGVERFLLLEGGSISALFWLGQVGLGALAPLAVLLWHNRELTKARLCLAAGLVVLGGLSQVYVIVIGGQAYPLNLFPGLRVGSAFFDGVVHTYAPGLAEIVLGLGGCAIAGLITLVGLRVLDFLPRRLAAAADDG